MSGKPNPLLPTKKRVAGTAHSQLGITMSSNPLAKRQGKTNLTRVLPKTVLVGNNSEDQKLTPPP